mgnify:FL=1|jgi:hypothetical protein
MKMAMNTESAELVALQALGWLASDEDLLPVFLGTSGASVEDLKTQATDATFLAAVLDFITMDDAWVMRFCDAGNLKYDTPMIARQVLLGEAQMHWT